jgi:3-methylcrotonyl-CoA carboxylase alpha subunit
MESRSLRLVSGAHEMEVRLEGEEAILGDRRVPFWVHRRAAEIQNIEIEGRVFPVRSVRDGERVLVWCGGRAFEFRNASSAAARPREQAGDLVSPMPGRVRQVLVGVGDTVARGQVILVLEAMKMEHSIRSPRDGVIAAIAHGQGELVEAGVLLAEIV